MSDVTLSQTQAAHVRALYDQHGALTPALIIEDAKQADSPLHDCFEWDVEKAAYVAWTSTARAIIRRVVLTETTEHISISAPFFVRDPDAGKAQGYVSLTELRDDPERALASLKLEFGRAESALTRARGIAVALGLEAELDAMLKQLVRVRRQAEKAA